jgi:hypothetical protein
MTVKDQITAFLSDQPLSPALFNLDNVLERHARSHEVVDFGTLG